MKTHRDIELIVVCVAALIGLFFGNAYAQTVHDVQLDNGLLLSDWLSQPSVNQLTKPLETGKQAVDFIRRYGPYRELLDLVYRASLSEQFKIEKINNSNFERYVIVYRNARRTLGDWPNLLLGSAKLAVLSQDNAKALNDVKAWLQVSPISDKERTKIVALVLAAETDPKALERYFAPNGIPAFIATADGCKAFNPNPKSDETILWNGDCTNGFISGPGTLTWLLSGVFVSSSTGNFERGRLTQGKASAKFANGFEFDGELDSDLKMTGNVTNRQFKDASKPPRVMLWSGRVVSDEFTGNGTWKVDDDRGKIDVSGHWASTTSMTGSGTMSWVSGTGEAYEGSVQNYQIKGPGVMKLRSGVRIEGVFLDGLAGNGTFIFHDGTRISGQFKNQELTGDVTLITSAGVSYKGEMLSPTCFSSNEMYYWEAHENNGLQICKANHHMRRISKMFN